MAQPRKTILCIDDDRPTAALVAEELTERGFEVRLAHDGQSGFQAMLSGVPPDLILCDIHMPGMTGLELLEKMTQALPLGRNVPFVFLTALTDRETELKGRRLGADDFVCKPIDFDLLGAIVNARLERIARTAAWSRSTGLTQREVQVLTWSARGKTSDEIALIVGLSKRTVDFHMNAARAKLGVVTRVQAIAKALAVGLIEP